MNHLIHIIILYFNSLIYIIVIHILKYKNTVYQTNNKMSRKVTDSAKKHVAGKQYYKCANEPGSKIKGLEKYECPLWKANGKNKGSFDESGYEIDHITERCIGGNDNVNNLQALCKCCHSVKTKRFLRNEYDNVISTKTIRKSPIKSIKKVTKISTKSIDKNTKPPKMINFKELKLENYWIKNNQMTSKEYQKIINKEPKFYELLKNYTCKQLRQLLMILYMPTSGVKEKLIKNIIITRVSLQTITRIINSIEKYRYKITVTRTRSIDLYFSNINKNFKKYIGGKSKTSYYRQYNEFYSSEDDSSLEESYSYEE